MTYQDIVTEIKRKKSYLCIGLDTDLSIIPEFLKSYDDPIFEFNKQIIEATHDLCVAYKPNIAFYESLGESGWRSLRKTLEVIPSNIFKIADAKRGDIGNTATKYAETFFSTYNFDAVTVSPYMGRDSLESYLEFKDKWIIVLALTSNPGSRDVQLIEVDGTYLYEKVISSISEWASHERVMFVAGATRTEQLKSLRNQLKNYFFLVPGVGAQGGKLKDVSDSMMNENVGLLVNSSRNIIYAGNGTDFAMKAREEALKLQNEMESYIKSDTFSHFTN